MSQTTLEDMFTREVRRLREDYQRKREKSNLTCLSGRSVVDLSLDWIDGAVHYTYWYENNDTLKPKYQCIQLADKPGTLSGDILRLERVLPESVLSGSYTIIGDQISPLEPILALPELEDDTENLSEILASLPVIEPDSSKHFMKNGKYKDEVRNLLKCQGGCCPGTPISPHIIQLLGKSPDGKLVFEKFRPRYALAFINPLERYKLWILQVISGLKTLHSLGIVHRDLRIDNLVFSTDANRVIIIDLESRWGNRLAPEVSRKPILDAGWTEKSDIYDLGCLIKGMVYGNVPVTNAIEWDVPSPLDAIVKACTQELPQERPSLDELYSMVDCI